MQILSVCRAKPVLTQFARTQQTVLLWTNVGWFPLLLDVHALTCSNDHMIIFLYGDDERSVAKKCGA